MPQTQPLEDKPLHSYPEPLKDRSNVSNDTLKSGRYDDFVKRSPPRMHRGAKKPNGNGTGAAVPTGTLRGAYAATRPTGAASSIPIKPVSAAKPFTTISATTSSPAATTANGPTSSNIIGGHRRRRSSFFEEWSAPLSSVRGPSPEKGRRGNASSATSPFRSSVASAGAPVAAVSKTIRGPISKELITGMAPLPAPSTVVERAPASATSAPGAASTTLKTVPAKAASVTTSTTAPNRARDAASTAVSSAAPAFRSSPPTAKPNCAPGQNITPATSPSRIPMSKTAPVPTKATVTAPASALGPKDGNTKNSSLPPKDRKPSASGTTRGRTTEPTKTPSPPASIANTLTKKELSPKSNETRSKPGIPEGSYRAPRGFIINKNELNRLSGGVRNARRDTIYFRVSFLENPWQGLKPVKTTCLERWW